MPRVVVRVSGVRNARGWVTVGLYREAGFKRFGGEASLRASVDAVADVTEVVFEGVEPAAWAAGAYHDENRNGRLDLTMVGTASEGRGYSNVPRPGLQAPSFAEASFEVLDSDVEVPIALRYPR